MTFVPKETLMNRRLLLAGAVLAALRPAWAHHGWSSFDQTRPLYLEGRAVGVAWRNPHVEFELELPAEPKLPAEVIPWHRVGLTHFSFNVKNLQKWHDHLVAKGVEIVSKPEKSPRGHSFFFVRDFDGNLIELMDLGFMYHVLNWGGPLGGWLFRRGMYKQYYLPSPPR